MRAPRGFFAELKLDVLVVLGFLAILWGLEFIDALIFDNGLNAYGLKPRDGFGLIGILTAPLLHGDFDHLTANSSAIAVLATLIVLRQRKNLFIVTGITWIAGGIMTWAMGRTAIHIGASGIVFGYLGYLFTRGFFERRLVPIVGAVIVCIMYGGAIFGVLPNQPGISWESHLFGLIAGIGAARYIVWQDKKHKQAPAGDAKQRPRNLRLSA